ncbi:AAA family ATPase [Clostridium beijerinckii]|uniref:AAA family ATPase n=1 Tax=Clostridium beijerinckii TaxID=1520 RepID=UPI0009CC8A02|nr:AAA family ATPase [Clostridium beijerinckii]MBA8937219.1 putative ATPase [Clostridium beijerinckii]NRU40315.1 ABC-type multidrug transport system ATPase subunit [Clostridium beijerinckii]NSA96408.1 putative ATPase [Clostridium beijerinckii]OOM60685.1 hypothetical protein CLOBI_29730 [Clostridium beijerinckii]OOM68607.1 hypothetical protein CLBEIC_32640 [Clostridium beijerinckii]
MKFRVIQTWDNYKNIVVLMASSWDDWFTYETKYSVYYFDEKGVSHDIGTIKVGKKPYPTNSKKPGIPEEFDELPDGFFSLGQSEYYYERLKDLNDKIYNGFRIDLLERLKDIAFNEELFEKVKDYRVTLSSLLRDISATTVKGQFRRIAGGGAKLTPYDFKYISSNENGVTPFEISFSVKPNSKIPTNIHVLIGRNGVGKTHLMRNMIYSLMGASDDKRYGEFIFDEVSNHITFANIVYVSFSAFDNISEWYSRDKFKNSIPFTPIGLDSSLEDTHCINKSPSTKEEITNLTLEERFANSIEIFSGGYKVELWKNAIILLESDPLFKESDLLSIFNGDGTVNKEVAKKLYHKLSSGHKIIMLTITKLVEKVEEKTLVFLDEPEGHLHPPLLASFIRALSELLNNRNGVAIIATHSPVVLQEVPKRCVWKLRRNGHIAVAERLEIESFGQSVGSLTREVFGLEVTNSGFHNILKKASDINDDFDEMMEYFNYELGVEAMAMIQTILANKE